MSDTIKNDASVVNSLLHPQARLIHRVLNPSERKEAVDLILIDDEENILQAIRAGLHLRSVFFCGETAASNSRESLPSNVPHIEVQRRTCKKLFGSEKLSRVFAIAEAPPERSLEELVAVKRDIVVLDGIGISGNIGAIIRTSAAMGAAGIVLVNPGTNSLYDRRIIRASRGYVFAVPVVMSSPEHLIEACARHERPLVVTLPRAGTPLDAISSLDRPLAFVCGAEKRGCSSRLMEAAMLRVEIPMAGEVESLNVAAAAAITLYCRYEANRRNLFMLARKHS